MKLKPSDFLVLVFTVIHENYFTDNFQGEDFRENSRGGGTLNNKSSDCPKVSPCIHITARSYLIKKLHFIQMIQTIKDLELNEMNPLDEVKPNQINRYK